METSANAVPPVPLARLVVPSFPLIVFLREGDLRKKCNHCGSSMRRKFFFKVLGCESPECSNYWHNADVEASADTNTQPTKPNDTTNIPTPPSRST